MASKLNLNGIQSFQGLKPKFKGNKPAFQGKPEAPAFQGEPKPEFTGKSSSFKGQGLNIKG